MSRWHKAIALAAAALLLPAAAGGRAESIGPWNPSGSASADVAQMENRLAELGYFASEGDDTYDAETRAALESFQQANGLEVTGAADAITLERLNSDDAVSRQEYLTRFSNAYAQMATLRAGDVSGDVLVTQRRLKEYGYFSDEPDGIFGDSTERAVESFQMVNGLTVTGVADGATLMRLMADSPITWPAFLEEMSAGEGDAGLNVYALQKKLAQLGYFTGSCTGGYGELTREAVLRFQRENGLAATGQANAATWSALYSGAAKSPRRADALQFGDYGDGVLAAQERLNALGFFDHELSGSFGYTTETAVRLFQMATSLTPTGMLDADTQSRMMAASAASMLDGIVQARFTLILDDADAQNQADIARLARQLVGAHFGTADDELYPGFAFVQYVCVAAGLPVTFPEDLIRMADRQVETLDAVDPGDIVAFQSASADAVTMVLAIGVGDGLVVGTTESAGWAEPSYMDQLRGATIYCWDAE